MMFICIQIYKISLSILHIYNQNLEFNIKCMKDIQDLITDTNDP